MTRLICAVALVATVCLGGMALAQSGSSSNSKNPPSAKKIRKVTNIHGDTLIDDYYWLRDKKNPEVIAYLEAENAYTDAVMRHTEALQEALYTEMLGRIKETDVNVPFRKGNYYYYTRTEKGKQYPIYCRKRGSLEAPEEVTIDLNELGKGLKFISIGTYNVSPDGNLLAYSLDTTGFREYKLQVKDLRSGQVLPDAIEKVTAVAWANDNKTLFYVTTDPAKRPYRLYRHALGQKSDDLIFEEKDELYRIYVARTKSEAYLLMGSNSSTTSEFRYISANKPGEAWKTVLPRENDHEYEVDHHGEHFYIRTNKGAKTFRLVAAPISDPTEKNWKEVIAPRKEVTLEGMDFFANHYVLFEREDGLPRLRITDMKSGASHRIDMPEPVYSAFPNANPEFNTTTFRYSYQSFITPSSIYDYDMTTRKRELLKQTEVLGGYDPSLYESKRIYATATDGVKVPISLVYKKDLKLDGQRPLFLYGYGSYGASMPVSFNSSRLSLLNRGIVYAIAHIRGGGDLGKEWHDAGKMMQKKNTFTDFIASAEHLINEKYTAKDRLIIEGGSAGGLLMGAVVNMRPDLFKAVISKVAFVDVMNTMLDASLPLTVGEYLEWGNPNEKAAYEYMKSYSPYDNITDQPYPTMLVKTSLNDSQVMYWEPAKYVARMRATRNDKNLLLLKTNMAAGHGGASGRYDFLKEVAFDYAFILTQLGIEK